MNNWNISIFISFFIQNWPKLLVFVITSVMCSKISAHKFQVARESLRCTQTSYGRYHDILKQHTPLISDTTWGFNTCERTSSNDAVYIPGAVEIIVEVLSRSLEFLIKARHNGHMVHLVWGAFVLFGKMVFHYWAHYLRSNEQFQLLKSKLVRILDLPKKQ